jgi:pectate lyase
MIASYRLGIRFTGSFTPDPDPDPDPDPIIVGQGWAGLYNSGAGVTGGGDLTPSVFSSFSAMWDDIVSTGLTVPKNYLYTGPDVTFSKGDAIVIGRTNLKNKTIAASAGQKIINADTEFRGNENIIWRNWYHQDSHNDMVGIKQNSLGILIENCTFDGVGSATVDGGLDVTGGADLVSIIGCLFKDINRTGIAGNSSTLSRITYAYSYYLNCIQRMPLASNCWVDWLGNVHDFTGSIPSGQKIVQLRDGAEVYTRNNYFTKGDEIFRFDVGSTGGGVVSENNFIGDYEERTDAINPHLVTWSPWTESGYEITALDYTDARAYVLANAGVKIVV